MSGKNLKIDGKVCPNVTVIKALDTDQNKLVEFVDTSDANATSSDIITGKTAYVDGKKVIGEATAGIDTSDATAIAADIRLGKTAYAKDAKLTGTIEDYAGSTPIQLTNQNGEKLNTKGKYCPEDITVVPQLQEKTVTPSETQQTATPDANYAGLSKVIVGAVQTKEVTVTPAKGQQVLEVTDNKYYKKVTVEAIPADYVIPSGTIQITENGVVDVSGKANANVNVPTGVDTNDATAVSGDILSGKTAYAKGVKLTGSVLTYDGAFVGNTHTITATLTNVTAASGNATTIAVGETKVLTYTAADGYALPDTVTVKGATGVWNKNAGTLTLSNPTANVTFTIAGVEAASGYNVTFAGWTVDVDYGAFVRVYDAQSATGDYTELPSSGGTVKCTSGYLYLKGNYGNTGYTDSTIAAPTVTGGVTIESIDPDTGGSTGDSWILFKVTGDGTVGSFHITCFIEGTQISLADGTTKAIEDITHDDELLVWNFHEGKFDRAKPTWIKVEEIAPRYDLVKFSNGREFGTVGAGGEKGYHRVFNKEAGAFTHIGTSATPIGTTTFADDGTNPTIVSEEIIEKPVKYYNIITDKHFNIFANGILTSCRLSNKYHIEDMKYVGEPVIHEQEEKEYRERLEKNRKWLG